MNADMIEFTTDDRTETVIREALRDRQAQAAQAPAGQAMRHDSYSGAALAVGPL